MSDFANSTKLRQELAGAWALVDSLRAERDEWIAGHRIAVDRALQAEAERDALQRIAGDSRDK